APAPLEKPCSCRHARADLGEIRPYTKMAGARVAKNEGAWRGWQVAACIALLSSPVAAEAPKSPPPGALMQLSMEPAHQRLMDAAWQTGAQVAEAYRRSPVLVMGLALAGALPLVAGIFAVGRALRRRAARTERDVPSAPELARVGDKAWIDI